MERIGIDLLHRPSRQALLERVGTESKRILVITEGVISYFSVSDASLLAADLHAVSSMHGWIQNFDNSGKPALPRAWAKRFESAPFLFAVKDWFEFFVNYGWQASKKITSFEESSRINRPYSLDFPYGLLMRAIPKEWRQNILSLSGAVLMERGSKTRKDARPLR